MNGFYIWLLSGFLYGVFMITILIFGNDIIDYFNKNKNETKNN